MVLAETQVQYFVILDQSGVHAGVFREIKSPDYYFLDLYSDSGWIRDESLKRFTTNQELNAIKVSREEATAVTIYLAEQEHQKELNQRVSKLALLDILGPKLLSELLNVSPDKVASNIKLEKKFSNLVEAKIEFLSQVVFNLKITYANAGISSWFKRKKLGFERTTPLEKLSGNWSPKHKVAKEIYNIALNINKE